MLRALCLTMLFLLSACMTEDQKNSLHEKADAPLTCAAGGDCAAKWKRAKQWVDENSRFEIVKANDAIIETTQPANTSNVWITVTKKPKTTPEGEAMPSEYEILFKAECSNLLGCYPTALQLKASFVQYVDATATSDDARDDNDLGFTFEPVDPVRPVSSVIVASVAPKSPASRAGFMKGDRIVRFNGAAATSPARISEMTSGIQPGGVFPVQFIRSGQTIVVYVRG